MLIKFENPTNGRFYYIFSHIENNKLALSIVRGGKTKRIIENYFFEDEFSIEKEIQKRVKRRLKRGYLHDGNKK